MAANNFLPGDQYDPNGPWTGGATGQGRDPRQVPSAGVGSPTLPASFGGPVPPGQTPPPGVNPQTVYTDQSGKGYNPDELASAWGNGSTAFGQDPLNARVRDIIPQYGAVPRGSMPPANPSQLGAAGAGGQARDPRSDDLFNLLMGRAHQGLNVSPDDPIIKAQTDAYSANNQRAQKSYLSQAAEAGGPNSNTEAIGRSMAEKGAQATGGLQAQLMGNELSSRREEIQQALTGMGSMLTSQQQLSLQRELGLIDAQLRQQGLNSNNDQFLANLGLQTQNQNNYWQAQSQGLI